MNDWKRIWNQRAQDVCAIGGQNQNVFDMFCKLKAADGYDTHIQEGYYEGFYEEWKRMNEKIHKKIPVFESVYEVGCGSGVNLYLYHELMGIDKLGGIDYSLPLISIAGQVFQGKDIDLENGEAACLEIFPQYDIVLSEAAFIYFPDVHYGMEVLARMYEKAKKAVVIKEVFDLAKKEACMKVRRGSVENYDEKYKNLDKTFYAKEMFLKFAEDRGCECMIVEPELTFYWNNDYVFDAYLYK
ncbi:MAG: class I SAM-dependent methyltransferase [Eubacterium sp.]|nr:class I SAM-dependent methyltransferase [Eubacterium sp.]